MALSLPRAVKTLITQTPDATRLADGLAQSIQPVLNFLNGTMSQAADGTLQILRGIAVAGASKLGATVVNGSLVVNGDEVVNGKETINGDEIVNGGIVLNARAGPGGALAVVPGQAGIVLYVTNIGNTDARWYVTDTGAIQSKDTIAAFGNITSGATLSGSNVVSGVGFRATIYMGGYWTTTYGAGYLGPCMHSLRNQSNSVLGETPSQRAMSGPGSILAIAVAQAGPIGGTTSVLVYKNYQPWIPSTPVGSGQTVYAPIVYPKGQYTFARNDVITVYLVTNASGNTQLSCHLDVEYGA